jgi:putative ABC transport system permease protein
MTKGLSLAYVARNLLARKLTTLLTAVGMALVIFVFATVLMMAEGLRHTLGATGSYDNVVILRDGAQTEVQSILERDQTNLIASLPGIATDALGEPMIAREVLVLVNLPKKDSKATANVVVRGTSANSLALRPQLSLSAGRMFHPGRSEIVIGSALAGGAQDLRIGGSVRFGLRDWIIVGVFNGGNSGFDSEIWGDSEQMMQAFRRQAYSSAVIQLRDSASYDVFRRAVAAQPRLKVESKRESLFYASQSEQLANFISILGQTITAIFSIGAIIGAMITMYASVANRTREIGTLRALGFGRGNIVSAFLKEAVLLGIASGVIGLAAASTMQWLKISTTNFQTFSEIVFSLILTPAIALEVLLFAVFMGVLGGVLPALRAARLEIVDALRSI